MKLDPAKIKILLCCVILSLVLLLSYKIEQQYLWTDETFSFMAAQKIVETGKPILESGFEYTRSPIYHNILAFALDFAGDDLQTQIWASRIINLIFISITSVFIIYLVRLILKSSTLKAIDEKYWNLLTYAPFGVTIIFLTTNLTVALARETRMYGMAQLFFIALVYAFIKMYVNPGLKNTFQLFGLKINILWGVLFLILLGLSITVQPIILLIGIGILMYFLYELIFLKKLNAILPIIATFVAVPILTKLLFDTFSPVSLIAYMNPNWGETSSPFYYAVLLARNSAWLFVFAPALLLLPKRFFNNTTIFVFVTILSYFIAISLLQSKNERYIQPILPIIYSLLLSGFFITLPKLFVRKTLSGFKSLIAFVILLSIAMQAFLYVKELNEISSYTSTSIVQHKKKDFKKTIDILTQQKDVSNETELIADFHSAYTLYVYGYKADYIVIPLSHSEINTNMIDKYIGIPFISYESELLQELSDTETDLLVVRDTHEYIEENGIVNYMKPQNSKGLPVVYLEIR